MVSNQYPLQLVILRIIKFHDRYQRWICLEQEYQSHMRMKSKTCLKTNICYPGVKDVYDMHDYYKFTLMNLRAY